MSFKTRCKPYMAQRQQGAVLVIGMILLLVLTIAGVSMMSSTTQDEKLSGNTRRASDAFMAAEAGTSESVNFLCYEHVEGEGVGDKYLCDGNKKHDDEDNPAINPPEWFRYSCKDVDDDGDYELVGPSGSVVAADTDLLVPAVMQHRSATNTFRVQYSDRPDDGESDGEADCVPKVQAGISTGAVESMSLASIGSQTNSVRTIHFNLGHGGAGGEASWPAVFVNDDPSSPNCNFDFGPSNAYEYNGKGGPALSTNSTECADDIRAADTSDGQLIGGVVSNNPAPWFTAPSRLEEEDRGALREFYAALMGSDHTENIYPDPPGKELKGDETPDPVDLKGVSLGSVGDADDPDDYDEMKVIVVHGDVEMSGSTQGSGVLVITGTAKFGGTPNWDGLIIVLGGSVDIGGGGTKNGLQGTMIVSNVDWNEGGDKLLYCNKEGSCQKTRDDPSGVGKKYAATDHYAPSPYIEYCNDAGDCQFNKDADYYIPKPANWAYAGSPHIDWDVSGGGTARYSFSCEYLKKVGRFLVDEDEVDIDSDVSFPGPEDCPSSTGEGDDDGSGITGSFGALHVFNWLEEVGE